MCISVLENAKRSIVYKNANAQSMPELPQLTIPTINICYVSDKWHQLLGAAQACSGQRMTFATYPRSNTSDITTHPDYDIVTIGDILYSITDGIVKKLLYTAVISLVGSEGAVDVLKLNFSK